MTFDRFLLRSSARWITLEPADAAVPPSNVLFIDRNSCTAHVRDRIDCAALAEPDRERIVFGLVGLVRTLVDMYLIVVEQRTNIGALLEEPVWRVKRLGAIPVRGAKALKKLNILKATRDEEASLYAMLRAAIALPGFYFAHGIDLTRSAQNRAKVAAEANDAPAIPDFARADMKFVWNRYAAKPLADIGLVSWLVPLILGYVDVRTDLVNGKLVSLALIARKAADRPGLRFTARGADVHGNVSNYVETEQIVSHGDAFASYVLVRGSIPLLWKQEACIKYKPTPTLKEVDEGGKAGLAQAAFEKHFQSIIDSHGPVTAVSLVDTKGAEAALGSAFAQAAELMDTPDLRYVPWDFHSKTKGMKYENVDLDLIPMLDNNLSEYSYYLCMSGSPSSVAKRQKGVFRVNCIDSLDRTNVVQCVLAHRIMDDALQQMGVLDATPEACSATKFPAFEKKYKATWADHADALAKVYAGSGALKTDYTRTGKRTKPGMVLDGIRAVLRYIYQNFLDARRQDGIDLFLGVVSLPTAPGAELSDLAAIKSKLEPLVAGEKFLPYMLLVCIAVALYGFFGAHRLLRRVLLIGLGLGSASFVFGKILQCGHKLVARPKLNGTN